jgi:oxygen-independent coproporphyrinogen-3 oxidase
LINSLYVHVPFCKEKCIYCDFYSIPDFSLVPEYKKATFMELSLRAPEFVQFPTVYFGGGTPSSLEPDFFQSILSRIGQFSEVTAEINPEDANYDYLSALKEAGINRVSLGAQSFSDRVLERLGRRQKTADNIKAIETALSVFGNVSIDIIYGAPEQTIPELEKDLSTALSFPVKHISLYSLTVYEETPLYELTEKGIVKLPEDSALSEMYYFIRDFLIDKGFKHYEISNFTVPGFESKHNLNYWHLKNYMGIGPSAASYVDRKYWKIVSNLKAYIKKLNRNELPEEEIIIYSEEEERELRLIMGLRLINGVDLREIGLLEKFKEALEKSQKLKLLIEEDYLVFREPVLKLGEKGLFISNTVMSSIISELF